MKLYDAAHRVAVDFIAMTHDKFDEFDITVARNTILECLGASEEPEWTRKVTDNPLFRNSSLKVVLTMAPYLLDLVGKTLELSNATDG